MGHLWGCLAPIYLPKLTPAPLGEEGSLCPSSSQRAVSWTSPSFREPLLLRHPVACVSAPFVLGQHMYTHNTCTHTQNSWAPFSMALPVCSLPNSLPVFPTLSHRLGSQGTLATPQGPLAWAPCPCGTSSQTFPTAPLLPHSCHCASITVSLVKLLRHPQLRFLLHVPWSSHHPQLSPARSTRMMRPDSLHKTPFPLSSCRGWSPPTHLPRPH